MTKTRTTRLSSKVTLLIVLALCMLSAITAGATEWVLQTHAERNAAERQEANMRVAWNVLHQFGRDFSVDGDRLRIGDRVLNDFAAPVDRVKRLVGGTATIFLGDRRVSTNVKNPDGSRAVGTTLTSDAVRDTVLRQGKPYRGRADILGRPFFTAYDPILDPAGKVIGVLYVGIPAEDFLADIGAVERTLLLVALVVTVAAAWACLVVTRRMFRPLDSMRGAMEQLARGNHDVAVPGTDRHDEIGTMARSVAVFREAGIAKARADAEQREAIDRLAAKLSAVARGKLTTRIRDDFPPSYAKLRQDFNAALDEIHATVSVISSNSAELHGHTGELSAASDDLCQRTAHQSASLEETSAAMDAIARTVRRTADGASRTSGLIGHAHQEAARGGEVVREAVDAMKRIEESSGEIAEIISLIDGIAFQTNLLALNAGVEAARAGDAGKGFAVVASEVRALAQRSADAARDVRARITVSSNQVETGVGLVHETGAALDRIIVRIDEVGGLVREIAASVEEQANGLQQINQAVAEMDSVTQQNGSMADQVTSVARGLKDQADALGREVARFEVAAPPTARAVPADPAGGWRMAG
ncbi:methyl-accepting chemotaxis protein [Sphingomonas gellani]|uniref:Methyl-accepting chemotaxis protein n=1 Tax=Sphingomonas gellani TaxID=1166340 RepID=A0A1H8IVC7_9SPHN|nr:methyl-accepting chemotaxis protein [Sphingomonas gellani]SEN72319.1 methyl-accepting chemotaxis protein [Sphingomonas gellani]